VAHATFTPLPLCVTVCVKAVIFRHGPLPALGASRHPAEDFLAGGSGAECAELSRTKEMVNQLRSEVGHLGERDTAGAKRHG
jgi:hypothetical protein